MPEFNQGTFRRARDMQRKLETEYEEFKRRNFDKDGFLNPSRDLVSEFGRDADGIFTDAKDCEKMHHIILENAQLSDKTKREYEDFCKTATDIAYDTKRLFDQNINDNTLIGNDSQSDKELLDGFKINKDNGM